ncbi:hypothetical protein WR25_09189 isoform A [Diploscapter pachys]|uniref:Troponin I n=1 Tax=Diploscapter pachys TaxID=2018661 RepID=A0A2A2LYX7_9BILA|nr:hypothetical protein WR25_09189 isoform A [Diploscapter pachys]
MTDPEDLLRYGGAQADEDGEEAKKKKEEREQKKAEVRKRLEEAGQKKKKKKGFLTPERKKKLRKLLMLKASEDLKRQQAAKESERLKVLQQRTVAMPNVESVNDKGQLEKIYNDLFNRVCQLEEEKYDINFVVGQIDSEINSLTIEVNDLRGKFVKPALKKVSKYENRFKKQAAPGAEKQDIRANLKAVKKESVFTQLASKKKAEKPVWTTKKDKPKEEVKEAPPPPKEEEEKPAEEPEEAGDEEEEEEAEE